MCVMQTLKRLTDAGKSLNKMFLLEELNSKNFIHPTWGNYITLRWACEEN